MNDKVKKNQKRSFMYMLSFLMVFSLMNFSPITDASIVDGVGIGSISAHAQAGSSTEDVFQTEQLFEAEAGQVNDPWEIVTTEDTGTAELDASGQAYVSVPGHIQDQTMADLDPAEGPELSYSINVPEEGNYTLWARVHAPNEGTRNMFIAIDDEVYQFIDMPELSDEWYWARVKTVQLTEGEHELQMKYRQSGLGLDRFILTSNNNYIPSGLGANPEVVETLFQTEQLFEAEAGQVNSPWEIVTTEDTGTAGLDVSGQAYVSVPRHYITRPIGGLDPAELVPELSYSINVPKVGNYTLWARVFTPNEGSRNIYIAMDDEAYQFIDAPGLFDEWYWMPMKTVQLTEGEHELNIIYRQAGVGLDRFILTSDNNYIPSGLGVNPLFQAEQLFEAEAGQVNVPWEIVKTKDTGTAGLDVSRQAYVSVPRHYITRPIGGLDPAELVPELSYAINVPEEGKYTLWARIFTPNEGSRNIYIAMDDEAYQFIDAPGLFDEWYWMPMKTVELTEGEHELNIIYRQAGVGLDRFILTSNFLYTPTGLGTNPTGEEIGSWENPYADPTIVPPAGEHPRLFVRQADLPGIRGKLQDGLVKAAWDSMQLEAQRDISGVLPTPPNGRTNYDYRVIQVIDANALMYLLEGDESSGRKAVDMVKEFMETAIFPNSVPEITRDIGRTILSGAMVYDWCYDLMTDEERLWFIGQFVRHASGMEIGFPPTKQGAVVSHGSENQLMRDLLGVGIAVFDENPDIYNIVAGRFFEEYVAPRNLAYSSHASHQGDSYGPFRFERDMYPTWIFDRMGNGNVFSEDQGTVPYRWLYTRRPDGQFMRDGDTYQATNPFGTYWAAPTPIMLAANYYKDPYLRNEFLRQYDVNNGGVELIWLILFDDPTQATQSEQELPLTKYFPDPYGAMTARTGWDGGLQSSTVIADMKIGGIWFGNHQHLDAGQFQLYYKGGLAIDSGMYEGVNGTYNSDHGKNYYKRSIAHNTMLVYDPDETFTYYGTPASNDGGQRTPNNSAEPNTLDELLDPANGYRVANVLAHQFGPDDLTPDYSYIKGDITDAYSDKVEDYKRSFVFLNLKDESWPAALVVYDKVSAENPDFKKTWLLHSEEEPEIQGNTTTITRTDHNYNGKLVNQTLLPASGDVSVSKVGGEGSEFKVGDTNYPQSMKAVNNSAEAGAWRVEISPLTPKKTDNFLNVMQVMDNVGGPQPLAVESIESDSVLGAKIDNRVVLFAKDSGQMNNNVEFQIEGTDTNLRVLVTDLSPGFWSIEKNGIAGEVQYEVMDEEGTLYFVGEAGQYKLIRSDTRTMSEPAPITTLPVQAEPNPIRVNVNGETVNFESAEPRWSNDQIIVPYRDIMNALGVATSLNEDTLTASKNGTTVVLTVGSQEAAVNGERITLVTPVVRIDGTIYIPLDWLETAKWARISQSAYYNTLNLQLMNSQAEYTVASVSASMNDQNAEKSIDGNMATMWSATAPEGENVSITYDLGKVKKLNRVGIAWGLEHEQHERYRIEVSLDGDDWKTVYSGEIAGTGDPYKDVEFATVGTRYVRISSDYMGTGEEHGRLFIVEVKIWSRAYTVMGVQTSDDDGNVGENAVDGDLSTRWSAEGSGQWIQLDLGSERMVSGIGTAWFEGVFRQYIYDILLSVDGQQWTEVYTGTSSGTTLEAEDVLLENQQLARYVKLVGHGYTTSQWNSLTEIMVYQPDSVIADVDISGVVTNGDGTALSGAKVELFAASDTEFTEVLASKMTTEFGKYLFNEVEQGDYVIRASMGAHATKQAYVTLSSGTALIVDIKLFAQVNDPGNTGDEPGDEQSNGNDPGNTGNEPGSEQNNGNESNGNEENNSDQVNSGHEFDCSVNKLLDICGGWAEQPILKLIELGWMAGYPDNTFKPNEEMKRSEIVSLIVRALKLPPSGGNKFVDMKNHWASEAVETAAAYGIISGMTETTFEPDHLLTREQLAVIVVRAFKLGDMSGALKGNNMYSFNDIEQASSWAKESLMILLRLGIIKGYPDGSFKPMQFITRAEVAVILQRITEMNADLEDS